MPVGVLTGLEFEADLFDIFRGAKDPPIIRCLGTRGPDSTKAIKELILLGCDSLLSFGIAGGLRPGAEIGDLMTRYWKSLHDLLQWDSKSVEEHLRNFSVSEEISAARIIHPTRIAISGHGIGPSLFDLMALLGRERILRRINYAIDNLPLS
ncbi:MAG: hypothetical protein CFH06_01008 [Alphaproteobacteria bacterium MarineAlpha3_Bin5]|nr:MAG: hypothetical protein CFH06_01008 [Alphaproteobacteria bacterium MarineAlpha3_Bin5]